MQGYGRSPRDAAFVVFRARLQRARPRLPACRRGLGSARHGAGARGGRRASTGLRDVPFRPRASAAAGPLSTGSRIYWFRCRRTRPPVRRWTRCSTRTGTTSPHCPACAWLGYLSTTGVYGDRGGGWVDESSELRPSGERGRRRVAGRGRMARSVAPPGRAGPYLPARRDLRSRPQPVRRRCAPAPRSASTSRARSSRASMSRISPACSPPRSRGHVPARSTMSATTKPAPPEAVVAYAAELLGLPPPPLVPFEEAGLSPMARSFYDDNKRVSNARSKANSASRCAIRPIARG